MRVIQLTKGTKSTTFYNFRTTHRFVKDFPGFSHTTFYVEIESLDGILELNIIKQMLFYFFISFLPKCLVNIEMRPCFCVCILTHHATPTGLIKLVLCKHVVYNSASNMFICSHL